MSEIPSLAQLAPSIRFPVTVCVVCYGESWWLAERFLRSLYECTDPALFELRAGLNEAVPPTHAMFAEYAARHGNIECYVEPRNIFKDPLVRRMFQSRPFAGNWVVLCDDDTHFTRKDWLERLVMKIEHAPHFAQWGMKYKLWRRDELVLDWIRQASWYRGLPWMHGTDLDGNSAVEFEFATGAFWAMRGETLRQLDWPDPRLIQAGEDFLLGEALRQNNLAIGQFHSGVSINDAPRRNADAPEVRELVPGS